MTNRDIYVISDTHFHHKSILTFTDKDDNLIRGAKFSTIDEMDEYILEKWNSVVKPGDLVYHLGDVMIGPKDKFASFWARLNGKKRLIVGNHDDIKFLSAGGFFGKVMMWRMFPEFGLMLSHVPLHPSSLRRGPPDDPSVPMLINVHGHIHHNPSPPGNYVNVSVEAIDYTPVNIEQIAEKFYEKC
jgi:calcineurin-like phosphoesterase family protein